MCLQMCDNIVYTWRQYMRSSSWGFLYLLHEYTVCSRIYISKFILRAFCSKNKMKKKKMSKCLDVGTKTVKQLFVLLRKNVTSLISMSLLFGCHLCCRTRCMLRCLHKGVKHQLAKPCCACRRWWLQMKGVSLRSLDVCLPLSQHIYIIITQDTKSVHRNNQTRPKCLRKYLIFLMPHCLM